MKLQAKEEKNLKESPKKIVQKVLKMKLQAKEKKNLKEKPKKIIKKVLTHLV